MFTPIYISHDCLEAVQEAWMEIDPDFSMDVEIV